MNLPVELSSSPPTPPTLCLYTNLDYKPDGCHMVSFSQDPSSISFNPPYFGALCSSVLESTCDVHEDQAVDGVGSGQPT